MNSGLGGKKRAVSAEPELIDKKSNEGLNNEELGVSSISFWEIAMLMRKQRLSLLTPVFDSIAGVQVEIRY